MENCDKFNFLREKFSFFRFQKYEYILDKSGVLCVKFLFSLNDEIFFRPSFEIPSRDFYYWNDISDNQLNTLIANIGMVELVSYWKLACPKMVYVDVMHLDDYQTKWWRKLYYNGLGEFFYLNGIKTDMDSFMQIVSTSDNDCPAVEVDLEDRTLVPVGGGKDSVVTLELLKDKTQVIPMIINPRAATTECVSVFGVDLEDTAVVKRTLDATMLKMNAEGYLNGHTPFSALLAFFTLLLGFGTKSRYIALSNESSANEPTVPDSEINHQYSKSIAFENDFRDYVKRYISADIQYFSFLRPLSELQIAQQFALCVPYFNHFKSCNAGSKTDVWCGSCPKCLFTWIILSPFISLKNLTDIFGKNMWKDKSLKPVLLQLAGLTDIKPFECVGTVDEVRACLNYALDDLEDVTDTLLEGLDRFKVPSTEELLCSYNENNNLPYRFDEIIRKKIYELNNKFS